MKIYQATIEHLHILQEIGSITYRQHFQDLWTEQGLQNFLNQDFSLDHLAISLRDPEQFWLLMENQNAQVIGYAKLNLNRDEPHLNSVGAELQKIYFIQDAIGKNFASKLMQYIINIAEQYQQASIFLEVLKTNDQAKKFYQKFAFTQKLSIDFRTDLYDIGMDLMQLELKSK